MILVDTSIWVDHIRRGDPVLADLLTQGRVLCHPAVIGEIAVGQLKDRRRIIDAMQELPEPILAHHGEVLQAIERHSLFGTGLSYVDTCLLTSARLTPGGSLWTRDERMLAAARTMSVAADPLH